MRHFFGNCIHHINIAFESFNKIGDFFGRMLQVIIHGDDKLFCGCPDAAQQGIMLPGISHQVKTCDMCWILRRQSLDYLPAGIRAPIVDQQYFIIRENSWHHLGQSLNQGRQCLGAIVNRYHN